MEEPLNEKESPSVPTLAVSKRSLFSKFMVTAVAILVVTFLALGAHLAQSGGGSEKISQFFGIWQRSRVWVGAIFCLAGIVLLMRFKVSYSLRAIFLIVIFLVFAVSPEINAIFPKLFTFAPESALGKFVSGMAIHPSPMCIVTKPFGFLQRGANVPFFFMSLLLAVLILTLVANKMFCGWVCPVGAVQELFFKTPINKKPKFKLPFLLTNSIRIAIFIFFVDLILSAGVAVYDRLNPFEYFHWRYEAITIRALAIILVASFFIFRPFCYLVCPLGLLTWIFEHFSFIKVRLNKEKCTDCNTCLEKSPCPAIHSILKDKKVRADCHPCGRCLEVCPEKALEFKA